MNKKKAYEFEGCRFPRHPKYDTQKVGMSNGFSYSLRNLRQIGEKKKIIYQVENHKTLGVIGQMCPGMYNIHL